MYPRGTSMRRGSWRGGVELAALALAAAGLATILVLRASAGSSRAPPVVRATVEQRLCARTTFGTTTFRVLVQGVDCAAARAVVDRMTLRRRPPPGWRCEALHCWRGTPTYAAAPIRLAELVDVPVAPPVPAGPPCRLASVEIAARQYISCRRARAALAGYLGRARTAGAVTGPAIVSCNGDRRTGGYCAVTFPTGAQGRFTYEPRRPAA